MCVSMYMLVYVTALCVEVCVPVLCYLFNLLEGLGGGCFSWKVISGCYPTGTPKGEFECRPLMGTPGPSAGDPGLSLSHSKSPCNSPSSMSSPFSTQPHQVHFFILSLSIPGQQWEETAGFHQSVLQPFPSSHSVRARLMQTH